MKKMLFVIALMIFILSACGNPATSAPAPTQTLTLQPTSTQTPIPTPTITSAPTQIGGGSGRLIFTYSKDEFLATFPNLKGETNIFIANADGTNFTPITNGLQGNNYLMDVSPDGSKVLITSTSNRKNKDANLYLVNLVSLDAEPIKLAEGLPNDYGNNSAAKWINNTEIVYIGKGKTGFGIYTINSDGTNANNIYTNTSGDKLGNPFEILKIVNSRIYWDAQITASLTSNSVNNKYYVSWLSLDGAETGELEFNGQQMFFQSIFGPDLVFSPDGTKIAWASGATSLEDPYPYLNIASVSDINNPYTIQTLSPILILKWFPDGSKILVFDLHSVDLSLEDYREYYKKNPDIPLASSFESLYGVYEIPTLSNLPIRNYNFEIDIIGSSKSGYLMDLYDISPDGHQIILSTFEKNDKGDFDAKLKLFNIESLILSDVKGFNFTGVAIDGIYWMP